MSDARKDHDPHERETIEVAQAKRARILDDVFQMALPVWLTPGPDATGESRQLSSFFPPLQRDTVGRRPPTGNADRAVP